MNKQHILGEIRRTAEANAGKPYGATRFASETGIRVSDWRGIHWARWGDALQEAGYGPNQWITAYENDSVVERLVGFIRELGRYPTRSEIELKRRADQSFPSVSVFRRLGSRNEVIGVLQRYCSARQGYEDVLSLCPAEEPVTQEAQEAQPAESFGFVYLIKSGRFHKIGKTNAVGRREREITLQLPERAVTVHEIRTDDPAGIEAYWHKRFEARRKNGEWFELTSADVKAFKRRTFM